MTFFEKIRNASFWLLDFLKGCPVLRHYKEIKFITENNETKETEKLKFDNLNKILDHAVCSTPYYELNKNYKSLKDFDVINKNIILKQKNRFRSNLFENKKLKKITTSGSTGVPFSLFQNYNKVNRNIADNIYFSEQAGYKLGYKLFYIRVWNKVYRKNWFGALTQNISPINVLEFNDTYIDQLIQKIQSSGPNVSIVSHASALEEINNYVNRNRVKPVQTKIKSVIAMAESFSLKAKNELTEYFNCPIVSRYSNSENGLIGMQYPNKVAYTLNCASYHIEILQPESNNPVANNELGRIVITDLFNYATPLIRYDTGDLGSIDSSKYPPVLTSVQGRRSDIILNTKGEFISSFITLEIDSFKGIIQSQLIQETNKTYTLNLNVDLAFNSESQIVDKLIKTLGADASLKVEYVTGIPLLKSGKRKATINKLNVSPAREMN